jgi:hypothetical protein
MGKSNGEFLMTNRPGLIECGLGGTVDKASSKVRIQSAKAELAESAGRLAD